MNHEQFYKVAGKVLAGEATSEEQAWLDTLLLESEQYWYEFELLRRSWQGTRIHRKLSNQEQVFRNVLAEIDDDHEQALVADKSAAGNGSSQARRVRFFGGVARYAATLFIACTVVYALYRLMPPVGDTQEQTTELITKTNKAGQKSQIHLSDGTSVWLNAESTITYPESFADSTREVWLEGEAYFEVQKDVSKPFVAHSKSMAVRVLGTAFNVRSFADEEIASVSLTEGKVTIEIAGAHTSKNIPLGPGEQLNFNKVHQKYKKEIFDPLATVGWKDGVIRFKKAGFEEVTRTLGRWYGVQFMVVSDVQEEWSYTGTFRDDYLDNILKNMAFAKGFEYEIDDKMVIIQFN